MGIVLLVMCSLLCGQHAGGKVIRKLVLNASERKQRQKLVGLVVVEGSINLPLELQRAASKLKWQVVVGFLTPFLNSLRFLVVGRATVSKGIDNPKHLRRDKPTHT